MSAVARRAAGVWTRQWRRVCALVRLGPAPGPPAPLVSRRCDVPSATRRLASRVASPLACVPCAVCMGPCGLGARTPSSPPRRGAGGARGSRSPLASIHILSLVVGCTLIPRSFGAPSIYRHCAVVGGEAREAEPERGAGRGTHPPARPPHGVRAQRRVRLESALHAGPPGPTIYNRMDSTLGNVPCPPYASDASKSTNSDRGPQSSRCTPPLCHLQWRKLPCIATRSLPMTKPAGRICMYTLAVP